MTPIEVFLRRYFIIRYLTFSIFHTSIFCFFGISNFDILLFRYFKFRYFTIRDSYFEIFSFRNFIIRYFFFEIFFSRFFFFEIFTAIRRNDFIYSIKCHHPTHYSSSWLLIFPPDQWQNLFLCPCFLQNWTQYYRTNEQESILDHA